MATLGPKPWVKPLGKMSIFRLLELLVFIASKGIFSFQNNVKDILLAYIAKQKKLEKRPLLDQNHGFTPLKKCEFFDFLNVFFLQPRKACFRSRISKKTFCWPILPKKSWKCGNFWTKTMEKCQLFDFFYFLFLQPRKEFFRCKKS